MQQSGECPHCGFDIARYASQSHHLPPETILHGRYLVGRVLGEGGFGITYAGYDMVLKIKVAIKEYYPSGIVWRDQAASCTVNCSTSQSSKENYEIGRQKCILEAQSLAQLDDIPSVVRIRDQFSENNTAYIIMSFVEGVTLKDYVQSLPKAMTLPEILELLRPIADALGDIHSRGYVHRDISPDNIMVTPNGNVKLLDFGAVKTVSGGGSATEHPIVKRGFSPIEMYSTTGLIGPWSDIYAFAATIYFLLTGILVDEPMDRMENDTVASHLDGVLTPAQKDVLMRALAIQTQDRSFPINEWFAQLNAAAGSKKKRAPAPAAKSKGAVKFYLTAVVLPILNVITLTVLHILLRYENYGDEFDSFIVAAILSLIPAAVSWIAYFKNKSDVLMMVSGIVNTFLTVLWPVAGWVWSEFLWEGLRDGSFLLLLFLYLLTPGYACISIWLQFKQKNRRGLLPAAIVCTILSVLCALLYFLTLHEYYIY